MAERVRTDFLHVIVQYDVFQIMLMQECILGYALDRFVDAYILNILRYWWISTTSKYSSSSMTTIIINIGIIYNVVVVFVVVVVVRWWTEVYECSINIECIRIGHIIMMFV